ncbi:MAG: J domain-containing protein [Tissierellia bacterium]|nr:J domain-containing protein [Tissierellia bacterium]
MEYKDYYKILGVDKKADADEIKKKYRQLAKKYHPDLNKGDDKAQEKFKEINEAYEVLGNEEKRKQYDAFGSNYNFTQGENFDPSHYGFDFSGFGQSDGYSYSYQTGSNSSGFSDFFDMFFGGQQRQRSQKEENIFSRFRGQNRQRPKYQVDITVGIEDLYNGSQRDLNLTINGQPKTIPLKIPKGILPGKKIRIKGDRFGLDGDVYVKINLIDKNNKLEGLDLIRKLKIYPWEAALGTKTTVKTLSGKKIKVNIPKNMENNQRIRIPKQGFRDMKKNKGDLYLEISIENPKDLKPEAKEYYEKLQEIYA